MGGLTCLGAGQRLSKPRRDLDHGRMGTFGVKKAGKVFLTGAQLEQRCADLVKGHCVLLQEKDSAWGGAGAGFGRTHWAEVLRCQRSEDPDGRTNSRDGSLTRGSHRRVPKDSTTCHTTPGAKLGSASESLILALQTLDPRPLPLLESFGPTIPS